MHAVTLPFPAACRSCAVLVSLTLVLCANAGAPPAGPLQWHTPSEAVALARSTKQPLLIVVSASWCTHCDRLLQSTYRDSRVVAEIEKGFVPVVVDADVDPDFVRAWGVRAYPSTLVITSEGEELTRLTGYYTAPTLVGKLAPLKATRTAAQSDDATRR